VRGRAGKLARGIDVYTSRPLDEREFSQSVGEFLSDQTRDQTC